MWVALTKNKQTNKQQQQHIYIMDVPCSSSSSSCVVSGDGSTKVPPTTTRHDNCLQFQHKHNNNNNNNNKHDDDNVVYNDDKEKDTKVKFLSSSSSLSSLDCILAQGGITRTEFWESKWQKSCVLFPHGRNNKKDNTNNNNNKDMKKKKNPFEYLIEHGDKILLELMEESMKQEQESNVAHATTTTSATASSTAAANAAAIDDVDATDTTTTRNDAANTTTYFQPTLFFQHQQSLSMKERSTLYQNSLFAALLDGCSLVHNHADLLHPVLAALCHDMQQQQPTPQPTPQQEPTQPSQEGTTTTTRGGGKNDDNDDDNNNDDNADVASGHCDKDVFPYIYSNIYITPPDSQAVPIHADDRDVFIVQICGQKTWSIYSRDRTYPLPYTHQQVGKPISTIKTTIPTTIPTTVLPVPQQVLENKILTTTLTPGDVLYIPRGYVHCAFCPIISSRTTTTDTTTRTMTMGNNSTSFHVTLAIPTHDWTLAGLMSELIPTFLLDSPIISPPQSQLSSLLQQE